MARLVSMQAENFAGFKSFDLKLDRQGLVFIIGDNRDTEAATSNGACKSGIFKALGWALYGEALDGEAGDKVIHRGQKSARVVVNLIDGEDAYSVIRERWKQAPKLAIERNGEQLSASKGDLQSTIEKLIGVDWEGFRNTVLYGQGDRDRFVYPTTKDSERKSILHRIMGTGIFELCHQEAKRRRLTTERQREIAAADVVRLKQRIEDHDLVGLRARRDRHVENVEERVRCLTEEARNLGEQAKTAGADINVPALRAQLGVLELEIETMRKRVDEIRVQQKKARDAARSAAQARTEANAELRELTRSLQQLKGERCPVCTGDLSEGHAAEHRASMMARGEVLKGELRSAQESEQEALRAEQSADKRLAEADDAARRAEGQRARVSAELAAVDTAKARVRALAERAAEKAREARLLRDAENPHLAPYLSAKTKVRALKRERRAARSNVKSLTSELALLSFWARGFGPTGLPSFALDTVMPLLTERANHYLMTLASGDITVCFSTQRELKGGEMRDEIGITWAIEGIEDYPPSGGQWKKIEIATNFALMDLVRTREGAHVNILCLDECLDGLDAEGRQRVVELLQNLRRERESIFLIAHDQDLAEAFERTLIVVKEDGVSRIESAM